ncbi:Rha family transcriptional regulator [Pandoraea sp. XJJ-1]|uniref:Rha family transcriptional regulator n=1 Tax=Pandoraea sp. XJJ-1 TaxID=3002643 RepID=UPI0022821ABA|nr:Rha family transcriptional regulator [Pandoraea sp. XJJ-1]WAL81479.1 Rha family transcriptional regulator [Pandoraea sp. XJJ-1]
MNDFLSPLVTAVDGEPRASTVVIASGLGQPHASVIKLVRRHATALDSLGRVGFEIQSFATRGGTQSREVALLNEHQAALLISLMRNTERVVDFKVGLIREFYRMQDELGRREQTLWQQMHALIAKEVESKVRASFGSRLMLERRREIPRFDAERDRLNAQLQPSLLTH